MSNDKSDKLFPLLLVFLCGVYEVVLFKYYGGAWRMFLGGLFITFSVLRTYFLVRGEDG